MACVPNCPNRGHNKHDSQLHVLTGDHMQGTLGDFVSLDVLTVNSLEGSAFWTEDVRVEGHLLNFKLDTGSEVNVISKEIVRAWNPRPLVRRSQRRVTTYSGEQLPVVGETVLSCTANGLTCPVTFLVVDLSSSPILGLQACQMFNLLKRVCEVKGEVARHESIRETPEQVVEEYEDVFQGVGRLPGTHKIILKEDVKPSISPPRKVPLALEEKLKLELERMERDGVIARVTEPTDWCSPLIIVPKPNGDIRVCLDPRKLNEAIKRPHYQIPTQERQFARLHGSTVFTVMDASHAFHHLQLDEGSSRLCTFATPYGRYRFLVMPYGLNCAPEAFQQSVDQLFAELPDVHPYFDDILLASRDMGEHCQQLRKVLEVARKSNLKLNKEKLQLAVQRVKYLGHVLTSQGVEPDPQKVKAITDYPVPTSKQQLQRFIGMVTYLTRFVPKMSESTRVLRQLLRKDVEWVWDENCQQCFEHLKQLLVTAPVLSYFDANCPVTLSVDASSYGLGAVLLQNDHPVAYASVSLTETQQRYSQIEKELLAVVFAAEHFHYFTYGRVVEVQTDHKPLVGLSQKPFDSISPRLQRLLLRLQHYQAQLVYVPGKDLAVADALSRAPLQEVTREASCEVPASLCLLVQASSLTLDAIRGATAKDETLQQVVRYCQQGWPLCRKQVELGAKLYWDCRDELHVKEGLLCRGRRLVIPKSCREHTLNRLHEGHRGMVASKIRAREALYWPGMSRDIESKVQQCTTCQVNYRSNPQETLLSVPLPSLPWQKLALDFFYHQGLTYLLVIDYYSKYVELQEMPNVTAKCVINFLKSVYARHGIPSEVISDNGPPFNSALFASFNKEWGICHITSSPHFPRSNGLVERSVQTIKSTLTKTLDDEQDVHIALLNYRATPTEHLPSPSEMLMGRRVRTLLPALPTMYKPNYPCEDHQKGLELRQKQQHRYDRSAQLSQLDAGQPVWAPMSRTTKFASTVEDKDYGGQSQRPDLDRTIFIEKAKDFVRGIQLTSQEAHSLQKSTLEQNKSDLCKDCQYVTDHEENAASSFQARCPNVEVKKCGLFVDPDIPYVCTTPDSLINNDGVLEIRCAVTAQNYMTIAETARNHSIGVKIWKDGSFIFQNHTSTSIKY
ncbi:uncharacterized protein K02A2.6-like [Ornithodoros turicata]|uniref:uncharacterized protein K02A2.6-like n=1 Tax=Ornithodoros turicata TaxID=34597 RepID=UPI00313A154C